MKSLINEYIEHKKYGRGLVINEEVGKITVEFAEQVGNKRFQFPDAVEQYLRFEDSKLQDEIMLLLESKKQKLAEEKEKRRLEQMKLEEERLLEAMEHKKSYNRSAKSKATSTAKKAVKKIIQSDEQDE